MDYFIPPFLPERTEKEEEHHRQFKAALSDFAHAYNPSLAAALHILRRMYDGEADSRIKKRLESHYRAMIELDDLVQSELSCGDAPKSIRTLLAQDGFFQRERSLNALSHRIDNWCKRILPPDPTDVRLYNRVHGQDSLAIRQLAQALHGENSDAVKNLGLANDAWMEITRMPYVRQFVAQINGTARQ